MAGVEAVSADQVSNLLPAAGFFLAWTTLYFILCLLNPRRSYEWHVRSVTVVHAVVVCSMSSWSGFVLGPWPFTDPGGPMTLTEYVTCNMCLGYFLFDFAWCLFFQTEGPVMLVHHTLSIVGNATIIYWALSGTEMIATIFGSELTNPFLQLRWLLREKDRHKTWYGEVNDAIFMLMFVYLRIGVGSSLLYWVLVHPRPRFLVKLGGAMHYAVGWAFCIQIVLYAIKKYRKMYRQRQEEKSQCSEGIVMNGDKSVSNDSREQQATVTQTSNGLQQRKKHQE